MATVIGQVECPACGHPKAEVREGKAGAATIYCGECKSQTWAKSPKASSGLRSRIAAAGGAAKPPPADDDGNWLRKL